MLWKTKIPFSNNSEMVKYYYYIIWCKNLMKCIEDQKHSHFSPDEPIFSPLKIKFGEKMIIWVGDARSHSIYDEKYCFN